MPHPKDPEPVSEEGFAALEAKIEEVQVEAAIESELEAEDAALAVTLLSSELPITTAVNEFAHPAEASLARTDGTDDSRAVRIAEPMMAAARLHADTFGRLLGARGLQDIFDAQVRYRRGLVELYFVSFAKLLRPFETGA